MTAPILRADGLVYGSAARFAIASGSAAALAGGPVAFTRAELITGSAGAAKREYVSYKDLSASSESAVQELLQRFCAPRAPVPGLRAGRMAVMGIVNVTPDSFSDGGLYEGADAAIAHAKQLAAEGADILDIGGESTRPGAGDVPVDAELARVIPVVEALQGGNVPVSVDTRKVEVMRAAADAGAAMLNDVSALDYDAGSVVAARATGLPVVLMHAQGTPGDMQRAPHYEDVLIEVYRYLEARIDACEAAGLPRVKLIVDPGIGFGKTLAHNLTLFAGLSAFHGLGCPVLLGASRKRFIAELSGEAEAQKRAPGSLAAVFEAARQGVQVVRVHDVAETRQALDVLEAIQAA